MIDSIGCKTASLFIPSLPITYIRLTTLDRYYPKGWWITCDGTLDCDNDATKSIIVRRGHGIYIKTSHLCDKHFMKLYGGWLDFEVGSLPNSQ